MSFAMPFISPDNESSSSTALKELTAEKEKEMLLSLVLSLNAGNSGDVCDRVYYAKKQLADLKTAFNEIDEQYNLEE